MCRSKRILTGDPEAPMEPTMPLYPRGPWEEERVTVSPGLTPEARALVVTALAFHALLTYRLSFGSLHARVAPDALGTLSRQKNDSNGNFKAHFILSSLIPTSDLHNASRRQAA